MKIERKGKVKFFLKFNFGIAHGDDNAGFFMDSVMKSAWIFIGVWFAICESYLNVSTDF